jgi:hypothetical protein
VSMSTSVVGFVPPDAEYKKKEAAWHACKAAGVDIPRELEKFFDDREPDPAGMRVSIPAKEWRSDCQDGYEVFIADLPKNVKVIRFYNSY